MSRWSTRSATASDIPALLALWRRSARFASVTDSAPALRSLLAADPEALVLAEIEGALVGSLIAVWDGWRGNFYRLAVAPEQRRRGIATALLREGERRLAARGALRLAAVVDGEDDVATHFWQATGYRRQHDRARFVRELV